MNPDQLFAEAVSLSATRPIKAINLLSRSMSDGNPPAEHIMTLGDLYAGQQGFAKEAISTYRKIVDRYPGTKQAEEARKKILGMNPSAEQRAKEVFEYFSNSGK
jgi:hypothetical protein